jgi:hypothetical protein
MEPSLRTFYNTHFSEEKYEAFLHELNALHPGCIDFRMAETPVFVSKQLTTEMLQTTESIIDFIVQPQFLSLTEKAIPNGFYTPKETPHPHFIAFDFGICEEANGQLSPQLVEMQGFPSLFAFEVWHNEVMQKHFSIPSNFSFYLNGFEKETYLQLLKEIIVANENPENVILLEIKPHQQKTRIDFYCTQDYLHIPIICLSELEKEGKKLYYKKEGKRIPVNRIYNRIIFDELQQQPSVFKEKAKWLQEDLNVQWVSHPHWFYRISKFTLPFLHAPHIPKTWFLNQLTSIPNNLENYVLKPLFSFAGKGVIIDVQPKDIAAIHDKENWILQEKKMYAAAIRTKGLPVKAEIRIFYFWKENAPRPIAVGNLARLSRGNMIGIRYNNNEEWVGSSLAYFEL